MPLKYEYIMIVILPILKSIHSCLAFYKILYLESYIEYPNSVETWIIINCIVIKYLKLLLYEVSQS